MLQSRSTESNSGSLGLRWLCTSQVSRPSMANTVRSSERERSCTALKPLNGSLFPFGWIKLLRWLRKPQVRTMRVPLMGVVQRLQSTRMASQLAFMMIEYIRRNALAHYSATRGEIGWVLDDNQGMNAIADAIESRVNKIYQVYEKTL